MSIELHCPQCQKLIRAPDDAGGKHGKCPYCKNSVYIPRPPDEGEEIRVAPIDETDDQNVEALRRETIRFAAALDHLADAGPAAEEPDAPGRRRQAMDETVDIGDEVEAFVVAMRDSELDRADTATARLKHGGERAKDYVERMVLDDMTPEFEGVPPAVVKGFLKTLLTRLGG